MAPRETRGQKMDRREALRRKHRAAVKARAKAKAKAAGRRARRGIVGF